MTTSYAVLVHVYGDDTPTAITAFAGTTLPADLDAKFNTTEGVEKTENIEFVNKLSTSKVTLTKLIAGNQALTTDNFNFTISVNSGAATDGITYSVDGGENWSPMTWNGTSFSLTKDDLKGVKDKNDAKEVNKILIGGLTANDRVTITETLANGYTVSSVNKPEDWSLNDDRTSTSGSALAGNPDGTEIPNIVIDVTNSKQGAVPTGLLMTAAPYAGMLGLGGIFAGLFFRRKREED